MTSCTSSHEWLANPVCARDRQKSDKAVGLQKLYAVEASACHTGRKPSSQGWLPSAMAPTDSDGMFTCSFPQ